MILQWVIRVSIASGLIAVGSLLIERTLAYRGRARRHAWVGGFLASVALPALAWLAPGAVSEPTWLRLDLGRLGAGEATRLPGSLAGGASPAVLGDGVVIAIWLGATLLALVLYGAGWWRLRQARRAWRPHRLGGRAVLVSAGIGPAAIGLVNPAIVVPEWLLAEDERIQRLVVLHEAEHVEAGDHYLLALAPLAIVLAPWNPAFWIMVWRLRLAVEVDCDSRVLAHGVRPEDYGSLLIDVAGRTPAFGYGLPLATRRTNLERRLLALTAAMPRLAGFRSLVNGSAALTMGLLACAAASSAPRIVDELLALPPRLEGEAVTYLIDDEAATEAEVRALRASSVARMEVTRQRRIEQRAAGEFVEGSRVVRVYTAAAAANGQTQDKVAEPAMTVRSALADVRERYRNEGGAVWIDDQRSSFTAFDTLPADRIASLVVRRAPAAKTEIRVTTRPSAQRAGEAPLQPQEGP